MPEQLTVHPGMAAMLPKLTEAELEELTLQIQCDGRATDPIIVWKDHGVILDGHNRYAICRKGNWPYSVQEIDLPDEQAAQEWIVARQLGRRNLRTDDAGTYRVRLLELRRRATAKTPEMTLLKSVAAATSRDVRTVFRDKRHQEKLKILAPDVREKIESGEVEAGRDAVEALGKLDDVEQRRTLESLPGHHLHLARVGAQSPNASGLVKAAVKALGVFDRQVDALQEHFPSPLREDVRRHVTVVNGKLELWQAG